MSNTPSLNQAPILDAILQVKYDLMDGFDVRNFYEIRNDVMDEYPHFKENLTGEIKIQDLIDGKKTASIKDSRIIGYFIGKQDNSSDCVIETDKFTYTKHGNYTNWNDFIKEASYIWDHISKFMKNVPITRISTRFINKIEIEQDVKTPTEYLNTSIYSDSDALPEEVDSYLLNYKYSWGVNKHAIVTQNIGPYANDIFPIIFDIDVLNTNIFTYNSEEFLARLNEIRIVKNEIFFKNLTDKTVKIIR